MASILQALATVSVLLAIAHSAAVSRQRRQAFQCPQEDGSFEYQQDCSKFWRCDSGVPSLMDCQPQLIFNRQRGFCDWPHEVVDSGCQRTGNQGLLTPDTVSICDSDPNAGNPAESFLVVHPSVCNAFFTCSINYLYDPCTFCPEGMLFSQGIGGCVEQRGLNLNEACQGKEYVQHADKVFRTIDGTCWPFVNIPNPYQNLTNRIQSGGFNNQRNPNPRNPSNPPPNPFGAFARRFW